MKQERYADAEPLFQRALAVYQKVGGPEHPGVATLLNNIGQLDRDLNRDADAEAPIKRSLVIREKVLGADHPDVARSLNNLAGLYEHQQRYADAEPLYRRALSIRERALGPDHPDVATSTSNLAYFLQVSGRTADALPLAEKTLAHDRAQLRVVLPILFAARQKLLADDRALDEALVAIQRGTQSSAAAAVNKLAVRLAAGSDRLAELARRDKDLGAEADALDKAIVAAVSKPSAQRDAAAEQRNRQRLAAIASERATLQKTLGVEFPDYASLSNPLPLVAKEIQAPPLPDTADELSAVARDVGAADADIHLGRDASETTLKRAALAQYGIIYFATHGLVAGDVKGLGEPSLALSLPDRPSELDDGLLTASEVAQLKLNADWVVLSACNTIAATSLAPKRCRDWRARSSMPARVRSWSRIGQSIPRLPPG